MAAIYQWFGDKGVIYTTSLYPVESVDAIEFSVSFAGNFWNVPLEDEHQFSVSIVGGDLMQVLLTAPPLEDEHQFSVSMVEGDLLQVYLTAPPLEDSHQFSVQLVEGDLYGALVRVNTQDDAMIFDMAFAGGSFS
jgi:hypothetical protein